MEAALSHPDVDAAFGGAGLLNDADLTEIEQHVAAEVEAAVAFAEDLGAGGGSTALCTQNGGLHERRYTGDATADLPRGGAGGDAGGDAQRCTGVSDGRGRRPLRGCFAVSKGLLEEFGPERIRDTPLSESAFVGAGIGAALGGMRPIVEIMTINFSLLAADQILNNAATYLHMSGGQCNVPLVIRMATGGGRQLAAQHSHSLEGWYAHIPGIKVLTPATLEDARHVVDST